VGGSVTKDYIAHSQTDVTRTLETLILT